jgi:hypothetical protein
VLLRELGRRVHVPGIGRGVLPDQAGGEVLPAHRADGLEPARVEIGDGPRPGPYDPVPRARVPPLPVHDHRAGQHQTPDARLRHGGEQDRRAEVVVRGVLRRVADTVAEPDLRGLVAHGVHPRQGAGDGRRIPHVGAGVLPHVEHERLVPALPERIAHMGPDEPGTAGDQYTHTVTLGRERRRSSSRARRVTTR